jgi:hypothetical protein
MKARNIILTLVLSWVGALVITYVVYGWRHDDQIDELSEAIEELRADLEADDERPPSPSPTSIDGSVSEGILTVTPLTAAADDVELTVLLASDENYAILDGAPFDIAGSLVVRVKHRGAPDHGGVMVGTAATIASDGAACHTWSRAFGDIESLTPGQYADLVIAWDCEQIGTVIVHGLPFSIRTPGYATPDANSSLASLRVTPEVQTVNDAQVTAVSASDADERVLGLAGGFFEAAGSLLVRVAHVGAPDHGGLAIFLPATTADDGAACNTHLDNIDGVQGIFPGEQADLLIYWDCEQILEVTVYGAVFTVIRG